MGISQDRFNVVKCAPHSRTVNIDLKVRERIFFSFAICCFHIGLSFVIFTLFRVS